MNDPVRSSAPRPLDFQTAPPSGLSCEEAPTIQLAAKLFAGAVSPPRRMDQLMDHPTKRWQFDKIGYPEPASQPRSTIVRACQLRNQSTLGYSGRLVIINCVTAC